MSRTNCASRPITDVAVRQDLDVVDDADPVTEPLGATPLQRLPDRGQTEGFTGVDGDVEVLAVDELERVKVTTGRKAVLRAGDIEADRALVAETDRNLGDLDRAGELAHGGHDGADDDGRAGSGSRPCAALEAVKPRLHDLVQREPALRRQLGRVTDLGVHDTVCRQVLRTLSGHTSDGGGRLHDADRVPETLQVQLQRATVSPRTEPTAQLDGILGRQASVARLLGELDDSGRSQPAIEMIVQQHLGSTANRLGRDHARMVPLMPDCSFGDT